MIVMALLLYLSPFPLMICRRIDVLPAAVLLAIGCINAALWLLIWTGIGFVQRMM